MRQLCFLTFVLSFVFVRFVEAQTCPTIIDHLGLGYLTNIEIPTPDLPATPVIMSFWRMTNEGNLETDCSDDTVPCKNGHVGFGSNNFSEEAIRQIYFVNSTLNSTTGRFEQRIFSVINRHIKTDGTDTVRVARFGASSSEDNFLLTVDVVYNQDDYMDHPLNTTCEYSPSIEDFNALYLNLGVPNTYTDHASIGVVAESNFHNSISHIPVACWDLNENKSCDVGSEDLSGDEECSILDCRGAQGLPGPQGPKGDQGPTGPPGKDAEEPDPPTTSCTQVSTESKSKKATVFCPQGQEIKTGGGKCLGRRGRISSSMPASNNSWQLTCSKGKASVTAVCCQTN